MDLEPSLFVTSARRVTARRLEWRAARFVYFALGFASGATCLWCAVQVFQ